MSEVEIQVHISNALRKVVLEMKPSTSDDMTRVEEEINKMNRNALYETTETMLDLEKSIELQCR